MARQPGIGLGSGVRVGVRVGVRFRVSELELAAVTHPHPYPNPTPNPNQVGGSALVASTPGEFELTISLYDRRRNAAAWPQSGVRVLLSTASASGGPRIFNHTPSPDPIPNPSPNPRQAS